MKKARGKELEPLGATEFAATLNGDNQIAILQVLQRFTKQVRRERRKALARVDHGNEDGDSSSSDDSDIEVREASEINPPPAKKFKKTEAWKEDTQEYHVPFVGTAVSRGDVAEVTKGEWPTGLLKSYLAKSPLAVELTGDDWIPSTTSAIHRSLLRKKQTRTSRAIYKAYLRALIELVSAAVPLATLLREELSDTGSTADDSSVDDDGELKSIPFLPALLKQRLVGIFHLLSEETDKGRGKPGIYGGCGRLVTIALQFLQSVVRTSTSNARLVCRFLDEELTDGVLKAILRPPPPPRRMEETNIDPKMQDKPRLLTKPARLEAVRLATLLIQTYDSAVATYACTSGSREHKVKPGIVYLAFRDGLAKHSQAQRLDEMEEREGYFDSVAELVAVARGVLHNSQRQRAMGKKLWQELLARDPLHHLCDLSVNAPPVNSEAEMMTVLAGTDEYHHDGNALSEAGIEARRLLYLLLANTNRSPLLDQTALPALSHSIVNVMLRLLLSKGAGVQLRRFLVYVTQQSPQLLPELFRVINIPDSGKTFDFILILRFVTDLLERGPPPSRCLDTDLEAHAKKPSTSTDDFLASIWPLKWKRHVIGKAIQSENFLVVMECVKFVMGALSRFTLLQTALNNSSATEAIRLQFLCFLPDLQVILAVRQKQGLCHDIRGATLVGNTIHILLEEYTKSFPDQISVSTFDWMKLIPAPDEFSKVPMFIQRRVLRCLCTILRVCSTTSSANHVNSIERVLVIMLQTRDDEVYDACFAIAVALLIPILEARTSGKESIEYMKAEIDWWLGSLSMATVPIFCELVNACVTNSLGVLGDIGMALTDHKVSNANWSILTMAALGSTCREESFAVLLLRVMTKILLFQRDPIPFAKFLRSIEDLQDPCGALSTSHGQLLSVYGNYLLGHECSVEQPIVYLQKLLMAVLEPTSLFVEILNDWPASKSCPKNFLLPRKPRHILASVRFLIHLKVTFQDSFGDDVLTDLLLRKLFLLLLSPKCHIQFEILSLHAVSDLQSLQRGRPFSAIDMLFKASRRGNGYLELSIFQRQEKTLRDRSFRQEVLALSLTGCKPTQNAILKLQLHLLQNSCNEEYSATEIAMALEALDENEQTGSVNTCRYDISTVQNVLSVWWPLPKSTKVSLPLSRRLERRLSKIIARILISYSMEGIYLLTALVQRDGGDGVIDRCLSNDHLSVDSQVRKSRAEILKALMEIDPLRFASKLDSQFGKQDFLDSIFWIEGDIDLGVEALLSHLALQNRGEVSFTSNVTAAITSRTISDLRLRSKEDFENKNQHLGALALMTHMVNDGFSTDSVISDVSEALSESLKHIVDCRLTHEAFVTQLRGLGMAVLSANHSKISDLEGSFSMLRSLLFVVLSDRIMMALRKAQFHNRPDFMNDLEMLVALLTDKESSFDLDVLATVAPSLLQKLIRNVLKYGIHDSVSEKRIDVAASLLWIILSIVLRRASDKAFGYFSSASTEPSEIFTMVVSHSRFPAIMARERRRGTGNRDQLVLVQLMKVCMELSSTPISLSPLVWKSIVSLSTGGLSEIDRTIHDLLHSYSTLEEVSANFLFLDELQYMGCEERPSRERRRWDWLLNSLDSSRIRKTIAAFPADSSRQKEDDEAASSLLSTETDDRYDPAFILPLILGLLDYYVYPIKGTDGNRDSTEMVSSVEDDSVDCLLATVAKRLCDKGLAGLCLASLASKSEKIRAYAIAIMGILLKVCLSDQARNMPSWRERPQIAMLLSSVQRAFLNESSKKPGNDLEIPLLGTLVSTFLGRSSLSVSKADDAMYVPLNRYFLKSEEGHGAFQDMSRLPAFIALFCAADDDPVQSRKERIWALNHLRDGFTDQNDYRMVASCHAPELLLTSIENIRLSSFSDEMKGSEYVLMLDVIIVFLDKGGQRAASHLIEKVGLISWVASTCTAQSATETFPIVETRIRMLQLIERTMNTMLRYDTLMRSTAAEEVLELIFPVFSISTTTTVADDARIYKAGVEAFASISDVLRRSCLAEALVVPVLHPSGLSLKQGLSFLENLDSSILSDGVRSLCYLPYRLEAEDCEDNVESAARLCQFLLEWQACASEVGGSQSIDVIQRVIDVSGNFGGNLGTAFCQSMVRILLSFRSRFQDTEEARLLWIECLELLSLHMEEGTIEAEIAADALILLG